VASAELRKRNIESKPPRQKGAGVGFEWAGKPVAPRRGFGTRNGTSPETRLLRREPAEGGGSKPQPEKRCHHAGGRTRVHIGFNGNAGSKPVGGEKKKDRFFPARVAGKRMESTVEE